MRNRFDELIPHCGCDVDNPNAEEIEQCQNCPICGEPIDLHDIAEVLHDIADMMYHDQSWDHERLHTLH